MDDQREIVAFLSTPAAYGAATGEIVRHATHGSRVFLVGRDAYKLKRAIAYEYLDYATVARRRAMCEAELDANRRLAPELYLDVVPVIRDPAGGLRIGRAGETVGAVDWLVHMRRFAGGTLFETLRGGSRPGPGAMRTLAERIAAFHTAAPRTESFGGAAGIAAVLDENRRALTEAGLDAAMIAELDRRSRDKLAELAALLDARRTSGFVRRCHGDLHLNNLCWIDGEAVPFDAIEFNESFVCIDVLYDLAFLLMDLEHNALRAHANLLLNRYLEQTGDYAGLAALPLFLSCRAALRAHVTMSAAALEGGTRERRPMADALLERALEFLAPHPVCLAAIGGVSGTGKSTAAAQLAPALGAAPGAIVLRSDVARKHLWGVPDTQRLPADAYAAAFAQSVYDSVLRDAGLALAGGYCAIVDAVFGDAAQRAAVEALARTSGAPFLGLWLDAPDAVLQARIAARTNDASDATIAVLRAQRDTIVAPSDWTRLDASRRTDIVVAEAAVLAAGLQESSGGGKARNRR